VVPSTSRGVRAWRTVVSGTAHGVRRSLEVTGAGLHLTIHETLAGALSPARNEESAT